MQSLLVAGFVTLATAALPDKVALKSIFIDGTGTKKPGILTQAQINSIDRELTIEYDYPAFTMGSDMTSPFNDTCELPSISCLAHKFSLTPGMDVSTIGVRGYAMTSASDYKTKVSPTITFDMKADKKYTFLMFDGYSDAAYWAQADMSVVKMGKHYSVENMDKGSGLSALLKTGYVASGNVVVTPSVYAFTVWEHTQDAIKPGDIGAQNSQFTVQAWIEAAGIANASLVAMNYYKCNGNVYSRAVLLDNPAMKAYAPSCSGGEYSSSDKTCMTPAVDSNITTSDSSTDGATTGSTTVSGGPTTSPELSLIFGIALASILARQ